MVFATAFGDISGGHINPAVTVGLAAAGVFPRRHVACYIAAQVVGAIAAAYSVNPARTIGPAVATGQYDGSPSIRSRSLWAARLQSALPRVLGPKSRFRIAEDRLRAG
jgi:glycerol uptake facilitator-like aquaporin